MKNKKCMNTKREQIKCKVPLNFKGTEFIGKLGQPYQKKIE